MVTNLLTEIIKKKLPIDQELILNLHSILMKGLLDEKDEGINGEYRKIPLMVTGAKKELPPPEDVQGLMEKFYSTIANGPSEENFIDYLTRVHTDFVNCHPFRDGNGRMARLILNIILLKEGFPPIAFDINHCPLFTEAVRDAIDKRIAFFSRMILEALLATFQAYETSLNIQLIVYNQNEEENVDE